MTGKMPTEKRGHASLNYFHLVQNKWVSASLDDPKLLDRLLSAVERAHFPLRDRLIVLIACRSGACVRDILGLTIGDWRAYECQLEIQVQRQASRGQNAGILHLGPDTASLLRAYIHGERKEYDTEHRELSQLAETDPLFLTAEGHAYGYQAFVPQWETLCLSAGISLPLRGLRHWFVIRMLRQIEERTHYPWEQQGYKAALIKYMGWQSPKTLRAYELAYHRERCINEFDKFEAELSANGPFLLNEQRSEIERREELNFWQNY
jgi:integrase